MHRFYCNILTSQGILNEQESYHAIKVLRLNVREKVMCFDGLGNEWLCEIETLKDEGSSSKHPLLKLKILKEEYFKSNLELGRPNVSVIVSLFKFDRLEFGLEKAVELGVDEIIITKTKLSQFELNVAEKKLPRWEEVVVSASKQSERKWIPSIKIEKYENLIKEGALNDNDLKLVATTELSDIKNITDFSNDKDLMSRIKNISIWIGPEGGFVKEELEEISKIFTPVKISENILRAETAVIKAISYFRF